MTTWNFYCHLCILYGHFVFFVAIWVNFFTFWFFVLGKNLAALATMARELLIENPSMLGF
jgi:hypothetical protein